MTEVIADVFPADLTGPDGRVFTKVRATLTDTGLLWIITEPGELVATYEGVTINDRRIRDEASGRRAMLLASAPVGVTFVVANGQGCGCTGGPSRDAVLGLLT